MKIAHFSNTYLPHVGGVAKSVNILECAARERGHEVLVIAPEYENTEPAPGVLRVPAIQNFNGSDFSISITLPKPLADAVDAFGPDIIHSHHPFLLGYAAVRTARRLNVPLVFTHHTLYERYTHYVPLDSPAWKRMAIQLATEFCNLSDGVIAPSESIAQLLRERGVTSPIEPIPTGVDTSAFAKGDGAGFRRAHGIAADAHLVGTVGRMAQEKNLGFLGEAVALYLRKDPKACFLGVGSGDAWDGMRAILTEAAGEERIFGVGRLQGQDLIDAYAALDCFVFASQTETQGMVLAEAMAASAPVVALDGPGVREIMKDRKNGRMLPPTASAAEFAEALHGLFSDPSFFQRCVESARETASHYAVDVCVNRVLELYARLRGGHQPRSAEEPAPWDRIRAEIEGEWDLLTAKMSAVKAALVEPEEEPP